MLKSRYFITLTLLFSFVTQVSAIQPAPVAVTFPDVKGTKFEQAFSYLAQKNIVQGYQDGFARPNNPINRAEALKVLVASKPELQTRVDWYKTNLPPLPLFRDVKQDEWYSAYIEVGFENSLVTGYPDGTYKPANSVTVEEAVALILRLYGVTGDKNEFLQSQYIQNSPNQWFTQYINAGIQRNLFMESQKLFPGTAITRAQFFDILYRIDSIRNSGVGSFVVPSQQIAGPITQPISNPVVVSPVVVPAPQPIQAPVPAPQPVAPVQNPVIPGQYAQYISSKPFAISIPSVNIIDLEVIHPDDPFSSEGVLAPLNRGVGHLFSYPGGGGKIMVYGHSSSYPWDTSEFTKIFRRINEANPGDKIYVTYENTLYIYEVAFEETIPAEDTSRFNDNGEGEKLILYTCWPPDSIEQRYLVHAIPVETIPLN